VDSVIQCLRLDVDDLKGMFAFLRDGLGLQLNGAVEPNAKSEELTLSLPGNIYLLRRAQLWKYTDLDYTLDPRKPWSLSILGRFTDRKEEVPELMKSAAAAGGTIVFGPAELPWGYAGYVVGPGGNLWEIVWDPQSPPEHPEEIEARMLEGKRLI
jgi:uncharacterized protein